MSRAEPYRPSFFENYAAANLTSSLRPAFRYVFDVLSARHPRLISIALHSDDIFTAILFILETSQLQTDSALLSESFYALRRSSTTSFTRSEISSNGLSRKQVLMSVITNVLLPHLKTITDRWYEENTAGAAAELFVDGWTPQNIAQHANERNTVQPSTNSSHDSNPTILSHIRKVLIKYIQTMRRFFRQVHSLCTGPKARRFALKWYPRLAFGLEATDVLFNLLYLFEHTPYFSVALAVQGLVLRRANGIEMRHARRGTNSMLPSRLRHVKLLRFLSSIFERVLTGLKLGFFGAILFFRFLQYYYTAEAAVPRDTGPMVPPPQPLQPAAGVDRESATASGKCPLCQKERVSATACRTSGYVFCYLCIVQHVQENEKCPVTLAPTNVNDLVRVYDEAGA